MLDLKRRVALRQIVILLVAAILMANIQCVAVCAVLPCNEGPTHQQTAPTRDCHHKAPPAGDHHEKASCGHQTFLSEAAAQASPLTFDAVVLAVLPTHVGAPYSGTTVNLDFNSNGSPPPRTNLSAITILRV